MYRWGSDLLLSLVALVHTMRLFTLIHYSTAATCPVVLLTLSKVGGQTVNSAATPTPEPESQTQPKSFQSQPAVVASIPSFELLTPIAVPQFSAAAVTPVSPVAVTPVSAVAVTPVSPAAVIPASVQPQANPPQVKSDVKPSAPLIRANFTWDQLVESSRPASILDRSAPQKQQSQQPTSVSAPLAPPAIDAPNTDLTPIDTPYVLGTGDAIQLTVVNVPEFSGQQQIGNDGAIVLPVIGRVGVAGLSVTDAETTIAARLSRELRRPRILITVLKSRPLRVGIAGEIKQPGFYTLSAADAIQTPSIVQAIQQAGGVTLTANLQQVEIRRRDRAKGIQKIVVNLSDIAQTGDLSQNVSLRDGDSIFIPAASTIDLAAMGRLADTNLATTGQAVNVALVGEVVRPGAYKMGSGKEEGARPTLTQAIQQAGGITSDADLRQVQVQRQTRSGKPQLITLNLWQLIRDGDLSQDVLLQPGDTIRLAKATDMSAQDLIEQGNANVSPAAIRVNILGEIKGGGAAQLPPNSTLNQAILSAGGLDRRSAKTVELIRLNPNGTVTRRSIRVDLSRGIDPVNNPVLRNNDVIVVDRSGFAKVTDGLNDVLSPIFRLLPLQFLF